ncbi:MAG: RNA polymerase sigma factor [Acidobacteriota bacterium]
MISDEALFERLVRGELGAFDALYERHERHLFGFILRQLDGDRAEAEDVMHDAFLAVLRERAHGVSCFRAWLYQVARNLCLNRARSRQRACRAVTSLAHAPEALPSPPGHALEEREASESLRAAVARLPVPLAELYQLRAGGLTYEELAQALSLPVGTVKSRMHEMVSRLREEMRR